MNAPTEPAPSHALLDALVNTVTELERLDSLTRGRLLRALVELYRGDYDQKPNANQNWLQGTVSSGLTVEQMSALQGITPIGPVKHK